MAEGVGQMERLLTGAADVHGLLVEIAGEVEIAEVAVDLSDAGEGAGERFRIAGGTGGLGGLREGRQRQRRLLSPAGAVALAEKCVDGSLRHRASSRERIRGSLSGLVGFQKGNKAAG